MIGGVFPGGIAGACEFALTSALATLVSGIVTPIFAKFSDSPDSLSMTASLARRVFVIGVVGWTLGLDPTSTIVLNILLWCLTRQDFVNLKRFECVVFVKVVNLMSLMKK